MIKLIPKMDNILIDDEAEALVLDCVEFDVELEFVELDSEFDELEFEFESAGLELELVSVLFVVVLFPDVELLYWVWSGWVVEVKLSQKAPLNAYPLIHLVHLL